MSDDVYYFHSKHNSPVRFTIAGRLNDSLKDGDIDEMALAISICSGKDAFCKKTGRVKAEGRLKGRRGTPGQAFVSLYEKTMPNEYWKGGERKLFVQMIKDRYEKLSKETLIHLFRLH